MIYNLVLVYLMIASILAGIFGHFDKEPEDCLGIILLWPIVLALLPFIGIAKLTKKILDKIHKKINFK